MPHPWVYSAKITDGKITFRVEVTDLQTTQGAIEITGEATQVTGAFAPISCVTDIAAASKGDSNDPEEVGRYFVNVEADPTSDHSFSTNEDVTIFVRVSKVWVTVLGPGSDNQKLSQGTPPPPDAPTWGVHKADAHITTHRSSY